MNCTTAELSPHVRTWHMSETCPISESDHIRGPSLPELAAKLVTACCDPVVNSM